MSAAAPVTRRPAVAGYYYPAERTVLRDLVDALARNGLGAIHAAAVLVPHGSFGRSGWIAGQTIARVTIPNRCIVLGPPHASAGTGWHLMAEGAYRTPLGDTPIDAPFAAALRARCPWLSVDASTHQGEHAIEVVVPFLQRLGPPQLRLVPLLVASEDPQEFAQFAHALADLIREQAEPTLLIASSDLSQHQSAPRGALHDQMLLNDLERMDTASLTRRVKDDLMVMCGYGAAVCVLEAARALGASKVQRVAYGTSAASGGDPESVTGYAGLIVA